MNYFQCKIRYEKTQENGSIKKITEPYLVNALSFTESEARIVEEMKPFISGEFTVANISRYNVSEIFENESGDKWYRAKVLFITIDERSAKENKTASYMLVHASNIDEAKKVLDEGMKGTIADYTVDKIEETKIIDIFKFKNLNY